MSISLEQLWPLSLMIVLPFIWWVQRDSFSGFESRQRILQSVVRSMVLLLLIGALLQPTLLRSGSWQSVVYLLDLSASVSSAGRLAAAEWITQAHERGQSDHVQIMAFAANTVSVADPDALRLMASGVQSGDGPQSQELLNQGETSLEQALHDARRAFVPDRIKRLVLLSDGHETTGSTSNALSGLQRDGIQVFTFPIDSRNVGDAWVDSVLVPDVVAANEPFSIEVSIYSQVQQSALLEAASADEFSETQSIQLEEGLSRFVLEGLLTDVGTKTIDINLRIDDDPVFENNQSRQSIWVIEQPRVMYVEGFEKSQRFLIEALESGGISVEFVRPEDLPITKDELEPYDAIVFSDVPPSLVTDTQLEALSAFVSELGRGFVLSGGDAMYGEDGYAESPIEKMLPITFSVRERPEEFALIIVLDKSWSMVGPKIELSKEASKAAVDVLADHHQIGVVAFNNSFDWPVLLQQASNRAWIKSKISTIMPSGHTNIFPALEEAYTSLLEASDHLKHIILLSDGRTYPDDYEGLVTRMAEAEISVSTVAMGEEADHELLTNIAEWGNGRGYVVKNAAEVPQIFAKETQRATQRTLVEEPFKPLIQKNAEMFKGIDFSEAPPLRGYLSTQLKDTSEALLMSSEDDPILARWQFGLGQTIAFTSDLKNRWATEWLNWSGYGQFWVQVVREAMRSSQDRNRAFHVLRERDRARIRIDESNDLSASSGLLDFEVSMVHPDSRITRVALDRVNANSFEGIVPLSDVGDYAFTVHSADGLLDRRSLLSTYPGEYRFRPPNVEFLQEISRDTGGVFTPTFEQLFNENERVVRKVQLWPYLVVVALLLYFFDLVLRRVRLFESVRNNV